MSDEKPLNILHLEDNVNDAELVRSILEENQIVCNITQVMTRKDFQNALAGGGFDMILSDYRLPSFDGVAALAIAREVCPEVPYIFVSGNIGEESAIETLKKGATDYVLKDRPLRLVTAIKRALTEKEMRKKQAELEQQLIQSQKMEVVGKLTGGVAHDFNNMLTVISGYSEMLQMQMGDPSALRNGLEEIRKAAEKSAALTRQLLAFGRRQVTQSRIVDLGKVLTQANQMFKRIVREDIEFVIESVPDLGKVKADPNQIEQVVLNLVINARDAMPEGGRISLKIENVYLDELAALELPGAASGNYVLLTVKDTGLGMSPEVQARIFEPFYTTKAEGTGLGLATVVGIIKNHGGYIDVQSVIGKGTSFRIYLPRAEARVEVLEAHKPVAKIGGTETILLVEDEDSVRKLTRKILENKGYNVLEAESGYKAISVCADYKNRIHLLLTDIVMPQMNGEELSRKLLFLFPEMKVLYMSGYVNQHLNQGKILETAGGFLLKPYTPEALSLKIREILDQS